MGLDLGNEGTSPPRSACALEDSSRRFRRPLIDADKTSGSSATVIPSSPSPCRRKMSVSPRTLDGFPREDRRSKASSPGFPASPHSPCTDRSSPRNRGSLPPLLHIVNIDPTPPLLSDFLTIPGDLSIVWFPSIPLRASLGVRVIRK
ncbi:hypothetical protein OH77DRAFT_1421236 [Trametes cingulata]|nr:hypothetical protein OH77DRAFT_1421236 [Trametes cingulata]